MLIQVPWAALKSYASSICHTHTLKELLYKIFSPSASRVCPFNPGICHFVWCCSQFYILQPSRFQLFGFRMYNLSYIVYGDHEVTIHLYSNILNLSVCLLRGQRRLKVNKFSPFAHLSGRLLSPTWKSGLLFHGPARYILGDLKQYECKTKQKCFNWDKGHRENRTVTFFF